VPTASDDVLQEECLREATTNCESSYATCHGHAQFHAMTGPTSTGARYPFSAWEKVSTVSVGS
jgi:hypothetical protein